MATLLLSPLALSANDSAEGLQFVLLSDQAVMRGRVKEEGNRVVIAQSGNVEVRLPRDRVACWADSLQGLYQFQVDKRKQNTLDSHLALARWCVRQRYFNGAANEIVAAHRLAPNHPEIQAIELQLRQELDSDAPPQPTSASMKSEAQATSSEPVDLTAKLAEHDIRTFRQAIQPLLTNGCGTKACHGGPTSAFQLALPAPGLDRQNNTQTLQNLKEALKWLTLDHPSASPLLVRAQQAHGGLQHAPFDERQREGFQAFKNWVESIASNSDSQHPITPAAAPEALVDVSGVSEEKIQREVLQRPAGATIRLPTVPDPFDPELFNRRYHRD